MSNMKNFKSIITEERKKAGLTQEAFAQKLGITPQAVSKWENGVGYPDVTLFPVIAETLNIPIQRLFGEEGKKQRTAQCPEVYRGLAFICSDRGRVCYSSKTVDRVDKEKGNVFFGDGSEASLDKGEVVNRGAGEIRIYKIDEILPDFYDEDWPTATAYEETLGHFEELELSNSMSGNIKVQYDETLPKGQTHITAHGTPEFIAALRVTLTGDTLSVGFSNNNRSGGQSDSNEVLIRTDSAKRKRLKASISGCGSCHIEPSFDHAELSVMGSGSISAADAGTAKVRISGSGVIKLGAVSGKTDISIAGSGVVTAESSVGVNCSIAGSGDIRIKELRETLSAKISGSGDISCAGEVEELSITISGSGDLKGEKLTVNHAKITAAGSADIRLARIKGTSHEKLGKDCELFVGRRG